MQAAASLAADTALPEMSLQEMGISPQAERELRRRREALSGIPYALLIWAMLFGLAVVARRYGLIQLSLPAQHGLMIIVSIWLLSQYLYFRTALYRRFPWSMGTADLAFTLGHMTCALAVVLLDGVSLFGAMLMMLLAPTATAFLGLNVGFAPTLLTGCAVQIGILLAYLFLAPATAISPILFGFFWAAWWVSWLIGAIANGHQQTIKRRITVLLRQQRENHALIWEQTEALDEKGRALETANARLHQLSMIDGLTHVANRRRFDESLREEWRRAQRATGDRITDRNSTAHEHMALLLIDIDYFKQYNDHYGHLAGDACLQEVAQLISGGIRRSGDLVARYGGEEFAVLLPATPLAGAFGVAERIRQAIWQRALPHEASPLGRVTICIGVADTQGTGCAGETDLIRLADAALYAAKKNGRNQAMQALFEGSVPVRI
ncbi:MAG: diguanylate cyclase [Candidatus Macondimonas sp.]